MAHSHPVANIRLDLTENTWIIEAGDSQAAPVVSALGNAMSLPHVQLDKERINPHWNTLQVIVNTAPNRPVTEDGEPAMLICRILPPDNKDILLYDMTVVAQAIIRAEKSRGGLLIHGALAESPTHPGGGILLAGPGNIGKTTASNRLPPPWRSLSDDASLVIRDCRGKYWAHPWPTWSRFFTTPDGVSGPGGVWDVAKRVPLRAIFFLGQAEEERVTPLSYTPSLTYLMETVQQISRPGSQHEHSEQARMLEEIQLAAAEELVQVIPTYTLHLSLTGNFWQNIEETLASRSSKAKFLPDQAANYLIDTDHDGAAEYPHTDKTTLHVSYSGPSMYPTLLHHDLLEIHPYSGDPVKPGDVIFFRSPVDGNKVIHRVIQVAANGIQTRGDNNSANDPYSIEEKNIIGQVTAAWRNGKRHEISGGSLGKFSGFKSVLKRRTRAFFSFFLHGTYRRLTASSLFSYLLPVPFHPTVFEFKQQHLPSILKLIVNGNVIGRYDFLKETWVIDPPWKLVIDINKLPIATETLSMDLPSPDKDRVEAHQRR